MLQQFLYGSSKCASLDEFCMKGDFQLMNNTTAVTSHKAEAAETQMDHDKANCLFTHCEQACHSQSYFFKKYPNLCQTSHFF